MGASNKVVIGGLLVALALVGSVSAEMKCENASGAQTCEHSPKMNEMVYIKCPASASFVPANAFESTDNDICTKKLTSLTENCDANKKKLSEAIPGAEVTYPDSSKKYEFKIVNKKELSNDTSIYASCKDGSDNGFLITLNFKKGGSSDASSRATMPAMMLGALATLFVISRA